MQTSIYGYKKPDAGDRAKGLAGWFAAYNFNIDRLDSHNHDGVNSAVIAITALAPLSNTILAANWVASGSTFKQTITVPAGILEVNNYILKFVFTAPAGKVGEIAYLNYDRLTTLTYDVYCNDNTAAFTAFYR